MSPRPARPGLRIVTVTHFFPAHGGGIELVAESLVGEFVARGVAVEWFSSDTDLPPQQGENRVAIPVGASNIIERLTHLPYPLWSPAAFPAVWRAIGRADIVHIHEHLYCGSILSVVMARLRRRPIVITQHMGALGLGSKGLTLLYESMARLLGRITFGAATRAVFISANVRSFFHLDRCTKARLIFNGIDIDRFTALAPAQRRETRTRLGFPDRRRVALFVGRFVRKKGFHILEALTHRLPEVLWVFVGSGPENPAAWRRENVVVAGRVKHEDLPAYYQSVDLLILPSTGEGFPLVVQEALACGLGVLSTDEVRSACPQAQDLIRAQPTPREAANVAGWEAAARGTLADDGYLEDRDSRARRARELWSWDRCAFQYMRLFEEITRPRL